MKIEELIKKEGINNVALKTNIPHSVLNHLKEERFEKLSRLRVLGFLSIIEQEYKVDLSELREQAKSYYEEHDKSDGVLLSSQDQNTYGKGNGDIYKWLLIGGAIIAVWFLVGKLQSGAKDDNNTEVIVEENESNTSSSTEQNITVVPVSPSVENNRSDTNLTDPNATIITPDMNATTPDNNISDTNMTTATSGSVVIKSHNGENLWKGFLNLDTKERFNKQSSDEYKLETKGQKWVFVTGNGEVDISSATTSVSPSENKGKKHYFVIEGDSVQEIDRKEFLKLTHGKGLKL